SYVFFCLSVALKILVLTDGTFHEPRRHPAFALVFVERRCRIPCPWQSSAMVLGKKFQHPAHASKHFPLLFMVRHAKVLSMLAKRGYETSILALATVAGATPLLSTADSKYQHDLFASRESGRFSLHSWSANLESAPMNSQTRDESALWRIWLRFLDTMRAPKGFLDNIQGRQETCDLCERDYITPQIHNLPRDLISTVFVTTTLTATSTFTSFSATVISTVTQTLTFVDASQPTAAIPPALKIRRWNVQQGGSAKATTALLATKALPRRQQDSTVGEPVPESTTTVTATSILTTTVTVQGGTRTRFHTGSSWHFRYLIAWATRRIKHCCKSNKYGRFRFRAGVNYSFACAIINLDINRQSICQHSGDCHHNHCTCYYDHNKPYPDAYSNHIPIINPSNRAPWSSPIISEGRSDIRHSSWHHTIHYTFNNLKFTTPAKGAESTISRSKPAPATKPGMRLGPLQLARNLAFNSRQRGPGHEGQPTLFLDNNGNTPVRTTPTRWSITSDFGDMPGSGGMVRNSGLLASLRHSGVPSSGVMGEMSPGPSPRDRPDGYYFTPVSGGNSEDTGEAERSSPPRNESQLNVSGPESVGGPSRGSSTFRTRLAPPPYQFGPPDWGGVGYGRAF
ncbi:hypothetical protein PspLS_03891, partial [Pyricularia sp. CBS 133598]